MTDKIANPATLCQVYNRGTDKGVSNGLAIWGVCLHLSPGCPIFQHCNENLSGTSAWGVFDIHLNGKHMAWFPELGCLSYLSRMILVAIALNTNSFPSVFFTLSDEISMVAWTTTRSPSPTTTGVSLA